MKKIIVDFKPGAYESFSRLAADKRLGGLARKFYQELFDFPPDEWGRLRTEFGKNTFVSDNHMPFIIKVVAEERDGELYLYVTEFSLRRG